MPKDKDLSQPASSNSAATSDSSFFIYSELKKRFEDFFDSEEKFHQDMKKFSQLLERLKIAENIVKPYKNLGENRFGTFKDLSNIEHYVNRISSVISEKNTDDNDKPIFNFDQSLKAMNETQVIYDTYFAKIKSRTLADEASKSTQRLMRYTLVFNEIAELYRKFNNLGEKDFNVMKELSNDMKNKVMALTPSKVEFHQNELNKIRPFDYIQEVGTLMEVAINHHPSFNDREKLNLKLDIDNKLKQNASIYLQEGFQVFQKEMQKDLFVLYLDAYIEDRHKKGKNTHKGPYLTRVQNLLIKQQEDAHRFQLPWVINNNEGIAQPLPDSSKKYQEKFIFGEIAKMDEASRHEIIKHLYNKTQEIMAGLKQSTRQPHHDKNKQEAIIAEHTRKLVNAFKSLERMSPEGNLSAKKEWNIITSTINELYLRAKEISSKLKVVSANKKMDKAEQKEKIEEANQELEQIADKLKEFSQDGRCLIDYVDEPALANQASNAFNVPLISEDMAELDENIITSQIKNKIKIDCLNHKLVEWRSKLNSASPIVPPSAKQELEDLCNRIFSKEQTADSHNAITEQMIKIYLDAYIVDRTRVVDPGLFRSVTKIKGSYLNSVEEFISTIEDLQLRQNKSGYFFDNRNDIETENFTDSAYTYKEDLIFQKVESSKDPNLLKSMVKYLFDKVVYLQNRDDTAPQQLINAYKALNRMGGRAKEEWNKHAIDKFATLKPTMDTSKNWKENELQSWITKISKVRFHMSSDDNKKFDESKQNSP